MRSKLSEAGVETRGLIRGAAETGAAVLQLVQEFDERKVPFRRVITTQIRDMGRLVRRWAESVAGEERVNRLREILLGSVARRVPVRLVDPPEKGSREPLALVVTHDPSTQLLQSETPVEHLLPGSSVEYWQRRLELIESHYDVRSSEI